MQTPKLLVHIDYPHEPGYLHDCPACENACHCGDAGKGTERCLHCQTNTLQDRTYQRSNEYRELQNNIENALHANGSEYVFTHDMYSQHESHAARRVLAQFTCDRCRVIGLY